MEASAIARSGRSNAYDRFAKSAEHVARPAKARADLAKEIVEQISARREARANIAVLKTADEMTKRVLDLVI